MLSKQNNMARKKVSIHPLNPRNLVELLYSQENPNCGIQSMLCLRYHRRPKEAFLPGPDRGSYIQGGYVPPIVSISKL